MTFASAINAVKNGNKIHRKNWNGKKQYVCMAIMRECELSDGTLLSDPEHKKYRLTFSDVCRHIRLPMWMARYSSRYAGR